MALLSNLLNVFHSCFNIHVEESSDEACSHIQFHLDPVKYTDKAMELERNGSKYAEFIGEANFLNVLDNNYYMCCTCFILHFSKCMKEPRL